MDTTEEAVRAREAWIAMKIQEWLLTGEKPELDFLPDWDEDPVELEA